MLLILCLRGFLLLLGGLTVWAVHPVVLFQAVDESFLSLWLNWWAIAHRLNVIPSHWELHVACIGDSKLAQIVARFHQPGRFIRIFEMPLDLDATYCLHLKDVRSFCRKNPIKSASISPNGQRLPRL